MILSLFNYKESFKSRLFLTCSALIIISTIALTVYFYRSQSRSLTEKLESKGELLSTLLAHGSRLGVFTENADILNEPINGIMEDPEVLSAAVYTANSKTLALQNRPGVTTKEFDKWDNELAEKIKNSPRVVLNGNHGKYVFWSRVSIKPVISDEESIYFNLTPEKYREQTIGYVRVILDDDRLRKSLRALLINNTIFCALFLLIGAVVAYFVSVGISGPLKRLTDGVKDFSIGKGYKEIAVNSSDEIGNLATAFNEMITSLKKREEEKEELEEKLRHSQKMEAIGTLAGGVAHDFNNILMAIIGYGSLLQVELEGDGRLRAYVDEIINAGDRAASLTQRLLAFTRKQLISPRPIVLDDAVVNIEKLLTRLITEDVKIEFRLEAGKAVVMADPGQIDQVMINLVANARDAMPNGGEIRIYTSVVKIADDYAKQHELQCGGDFALIRVSDNGGGIPEELRQRIFDPFFTTKEVGKGTGLGLSMVYGIIKQHYGIIDVESEEGKGTTFNLYLPIVEEAITEQPAQPVQLMRGKKETILVAEDDGTVKEFMKGLLEGSGYHVIAVSDGEEAVKEFYNFRDIIDMVILDVIMPLKNGKEAYDEMARINPGLKAVFVSGYSDDIINWKNTSNSNVSLIQKPVQPSTLLKKLRDALD